VTLNTNEGPDEFALLSAGECARLKQRDRRIRLIEDLPGKWIDDATRAPDCFASLDAELNLDSADSLIHWAFLRVCVRITPTLGRLHRRGGKAS
jgi:hypothetical protein